MRQLSETTDRTNLTDGLCASLLNSIKCPAKLGDERVDLKPDKV